MAPLVCTRSVNARLICGGLRTSETFDGPRRASAHISLPVQFGDKKGREVLSLRSKMIEAAGDLEPGPFCSSLRKRRLDDRDVCARQRRTIREDGERDGIVAGPSGLIEVERPGVLP
jgi:hypothetical protein